MLYTFSAEEFIKSIYCLLIIARPSQVAHHFLFYRDPVRETYQAKMVVNQVGPTFELVLLQIILLDNYRASVVIPTEK